MVAHNHVRRVMSVLGLSWVCGVTACSSERTVPEQRIDEARLALGQGAFTLVVIGDAQRDTDLTEGEHAAFYAMFTDTTEWIAANAQAQNIRFVSQVGDIVQHGDTRAEYDLAAAAMATLDSATNAGGTVGIPWAASYGNHELILTGVTNPRSTIDPQSPTRSLNYRDYFATNVTPGTPGATPGVHRLNGDLGFGAASSNDLNTWHTFKATNAQGAREYLVLNLEFDVPGGTNTTTGGTPTFDVIAWAQGVIDAHPEMPTIIQTHIFEGSQFGPPCNSYYTIAKGRNSQVSIFDKLIKNNSQVFLVLSGHTHEDTHRYQVNAAGLPVLQMATDYTDATKTGGNTGGYFRRIELDESAGQVRVMTYSATADSDGDPLTPAFLTDAESHFTWELDWGTRFDSASPLAPKLVAHWKLNDGQSNPASVAAQDEVVPRANGALIFNSGPEWVTGKAGGALRFGPTKSPVRIGTAEKLQLSGAVTVTAWVKREGAPGAASALIAGTDHQGGAKADGFLLKHYNGGGANQDKVYFSIVRDEQETVVWSPQTLASYTASAPGGFVHLAGVFRPGQSMTLYVNGAQAAQVQGVPAFIQSSPTPFQIGQIFNMPAYSFNGIIDDVQVYASALTTQQVSTLFSTPGTALAGARSPNVPALPAEERIAHYRLDDGRIYDRSSVATDYAAVARNAALENFPAEPGLGPFWVSNGRVGGALEFDGIDDAVRIVDDKFNLTGALTLAAWVKLNPAAGGANSRLIAGKDYTGGATLDGYWLKHRKTSTEDDLQFAVTSAGNNVIVTSSNTLTNLTNASVSAGNEGWVHVAGVYQPGASIKLYVNGLLDTTRTDEPASIQSVATPFSLGALSGDPGFVFKGLIDDVQLYNRALTAAEVLAIVQNPVPTQSAPDLPGSCP
jgi:hypothetical protein